MIHRPIFFSKREPREVAFRELIILQSFETRLEAAGKDTCSPECWTNKNKHIHVREIGEFPASTCFGSEQTRTGVGLISITGGGGQGCSPTTKQRSIDRSIESSPRSTTRKNDSSHLMTAFYTAHHQGLCVTTLALAARLARAATLTTALPPPTTAR
ncbi:unnamed protein product [Notodromas monacha]|uniref:Uncharacterized protein n=1 Tax=Notodromas monacha TaxID=399045 RepID=A0A7R9BGC2_9CRUS|nr:unnamed protein product [Notodromas monacha]CAG0914968.1 unnamed protein product [Notodromas monacha]